MRLQMLKCKLHRATVTSADLHYEGSISLDPKLCEAAGLLPFERVEIYDINNGSRFATYVIHGGPGQVQLNGAAARLVQAGDRVIICSYAEFEPAEAAAHQPTVVLLGERNHIQSIHHGQDQRGGRPGLPISTQPVESSAELSR